MTEKTTPRRSRVLDPLKRFLKAHQCAFEINPATGGVHMGITGEVATWRCMGCEDDAGRFVFISLLPFIAPQARRQACAELLARINVRLGLGRFDLDFRDGELRFFSSVPLGHQARLSSDVILDVLNGHRTIVDGFVPALAAVLFAGLSPEKALALEAAGNKAENEEAPRFSLN